MYANTAIRSHKSIGLYDCSGCGLKLQQFKDANPDIADHRNYQDFSSETVPFSFAISDLLTISSRALHIGHSRFGGVT